MKTKKVIITGGAGFIGANLTRKLVKKGYDVTLLLKNSTKTWRIDDLKKKITIEEIDLLNKSLVKMVLDKYSPSIIYHLAANGAYSYQDNRDKIFKTNINSTLNLIDGLQMNLELFVNTGSSSEYGFKSSSMSELDITNPNSFYAISKVMQTNICSYYAKKMNMPIVTLRPFSVYGPYEEPGRLIPNILNSIYRKTQLNMVSKDIVRDFIHVDDYVDFCLKTNLLKKFSGEIFNVGSGKETNFNQLIKITEKSIREPINVLWNTANSKTWDTVHWRADIRKANRLLNFTPKNDLSSGLKKTWKWFKTNNHFYNGNN